MFHPTGFSFLPGFVALVVEPFLAHPMQACIFCIFKCLHRFPTSLLPNVPPTLCFIIQPNTFKYTYTRNHAHQHTNQKADTHIHTHTRHQTRVTEKQK